VSHSSKASRATVRYLYPGIQAKGLMSITSAHLMVKDATATSSDFEDEVSTLSDPQGLGHASSNFEDEVSASSDPKAWALTRLVPRGGLCLVRPLRVRFYLAQPPGQDFRLAHSLGIGFAAGQKQWPQGRTRTASTTTAWRRTLGSTSWTRPDATGCRIKPCWETHIANRVNWPALCCQLPA